MFFMSFIETCHHVKIKIAIDESLLLNDFLPTSSYRFKDVPIIQQRFVDLIYHLIVMLISQIPIIITAGIIAKFLIRPSFQFFAAKDAISFFRDDFFHSDKTINTKMRNL